MFRPLTCAIVAPLLISLAACATKPPPAAMQAQSDHAPAVADVPAPSSDDLPRQAPGIAIMQQRLAAEAGDRVYFALDRHDLSEDAMNVLKAQARWLAQNSQVRVLVAGNCDERGTREYNFALGARRAAAARDFLVAQGVAPSRIETVSYGKERPINAGTNEAAWSRNRNANTVIVDLGT
ncbi:peptidoglycan-associated lipoprotein [Caulobacter zeae]|uniref:Peptidoglycan-associated lipoprotein n=1 Tax=Caulobacter zeae TaxID=2055137 RepID=A0A2N5DRH8_9CAUL|nr:peptidoglycan-associated lipoprotein Pal [Caulobacter zeae]PLR28659.1 peptidoglycan-associated lipoprotein [Caulobacter zeae]